jgi:spore coat polysaccharide biosynthesis protein SpsF
MAMRADAAERDQGALRPSPTVAAIVQARMGSSRLPGKVLMEAAGKPLLGHLLERLATTRTIERIIVATSVNPGDEPIVVFCRALGVEVFRGSEHDVLDRYYQAARQLGIDLTVRITADCPLVDPEIVDAMVDFARPRMALYDLVTNRHPLTYPDGLDLDVIPLAGLQDAWLHADTPAQREHTIPYFWERSRRVHNLEHAPNLFYQHRWTLDYAEDYRLIRRILTALYRPGYVFHMAEILEYLARHPWLPIINAKHLPRRSEATEPMLPAMRSGLGG